jgi:hypothetical protein
MRVLVLLALAVLGRERECPSPREETATRNTNVARTGARSSNRRK